MDRNKQGYSSLNSLFAMKNASDFTDDAIMTPTTSSESETWFDLGYTPAVPESGKVYKIHLKNSDKLIMVTGGDVVAQPPDEVKLGAGWHWACVERRNWLGFRNRVTGTYLGCSAWTGGIEAGMPLQTGSECFCVRHDPRGGYLLLVNSGHRKKSEMQQVICAEDGKTLERVMIGDSMDV
jgi:hypothetical protein